MDGQEYIVLHREILALPVWRDQLKLREQNCPDFLHVFGLVSTDQIFRDSLELARGPMIALCFTLFLLVLSFPFLKLFFAPEERFRRVDAVLLLLCGALLVATIVFSGILGASLTSLQERDDLRLNNLSTNLSEELKGRGWSTKESELLSIKDPLPWGMGFAVLDKEDNSLGHSDSLHSAFEEITSVSDQGKLLRRALRSGSEEPFTTISMGRSERVKIVPLDSSTGEKLLVFGEQEPLQSIRLYTSLVTLLVATSCMLLLVILGTLLGRLARRPLHLTSFWPRRSKGSLYLRLALAYLLLGALVLSTVLHSARWDTVLVAMLVPAIAV
ncbi:MAG TPA: hypothetical protein VLX28_19470, partial [Thermoanaerobaculia bacterium]|nr:hypothetical protein [Thermoanaerobaculia bacterium]